MISMQAREGMSGQVCAYVVPKNAPKTCSRIMHTITALCMHQRVLQRESSKGHGSVLDMKGDFSASDMHQWLLWCLPEMPTRLQGQSASLNYQSARIGTQLHVMYEGSRLEALSDNICTLSMLRDSLVQYASSTT
jgi:Bardet-Biedl syndrome 7 protein